MLVISNKAPVKVEAQRTDRNTSLISELKLGQRGLLIPIKVPKDWLGKFERTEFSNVSARILTEVFDEGIILVLLIYWCI